MLEMISSIDLKNAITRYNREAEEYETIAELWEKVTRDHKKDGSDFSIMSKNFSGCAFKEPHLMKMHAYEKEITVSGRTKSGRFVTNYIDNYKCVKYTNIKVEESRVINERFLEPYFYLTADEIETLIKETAANYRKWAETARERAENATAAAELYNAKMEEINKELKDKNFPFDAYDIQRFGK